MSIPVCLDAESIHQPAQSILNIFVGQSRTNQKQDRNSFLGSTLRIYFVETSTANLVDYASVGVKNFLVSYYYEKSGRIIDKIRKLVPDANIMLDSGAFTAFTKKDAIDLDKYITYIKEHRSEFQHVVALDVIKDAENTKINYDYMLKQGIKDAIPTWHAGSDFSYLDYYTKKTNYIAIGGVVYLKFQHRQLFNWIRNVLDRVPKSVKIHIFGTTNFNLIYRFADRLESVDAATIPKKSAYNVAVTYTGMAKQTGFQYKGRINEDQIHRLQQYSILKMLNMEQEINQYLEKKNGIKIQE